VKHWSLFYYAAEFSSNTEASWAGKAPLAASYSLCLGSALIQTSQLATEEEESHTLAVLIKCYFQPEGGVEGLIQEAEGVGGCLIQKWEGEWEQMESPYLAGEGEEVFPLQEEGVEEVFPLQEEVGEEVFLHLAGEGEEVFPLQEEWGEEVFPHLAREGEEVFPHQAKAEEGGVAFLYQAEEEVGGWLYWAEQALLCQGEGEVGGPPCPHQAWSWRTLCKVEVGRVGCYGCCQRKRKQSIDGWFQTQYEEKDGKVVTRPVFDCQTSEGMEVLEAKWADVCRAVLIFALETQSKKSLSRILSEVQKVRRA